MRICPNCHKELSDEQVFCDACGAKLELDEVKAEAVEAPAVEATEEPKKESALAGLVAQAKALALKAKELAIKGKDALLAMPKKKLLTVGGIALGALVVLIVLIALLAGGRKPDYQLFIKDGQICYIDLNKGDVIELTKNLKGDSEITNSELAGAADELSYYVHMNKKGNRIFYPDRIGDGMTLYTRNLKKLKEEPLKLDNGVVKYDINTKGTHVVYLKSEGETGTLYLHDLKEKTRLASGVQNYYADEQCKKVLYKNEEGNVYVLTIGKDEPVKVASNIESLNFVFEDLSAVFYTKEGAMYLQKVGKEDRIKVDEEVYRTVETYDSGKMYYIKRVVTEESLMNFVDDDMAASDATMEGYSYEKQRRDNMRENLKEQTFEFTKYSLYFFDGKESKLVAEELSDSYAYEVCSDKEMLVASIVEATTLPKFKLSELDYASDVYSKLNEYLDGRTKEYYLAVEAELHQLDAAGDNLIFAPDGAAIYYLDDVVYNEETDQSTGDLYEIIIKKGKPEAAKAYDEDVSTRYLRFLDEDLVYFKNMTSSNSGDLYVNGKEVDYDVRTSGIQNTDMGLLYFSEWDAEHSSGTLKLFKKGKKTVVANDVSDYIITEEGELVYLYDYSTKYYTGTMYYYNGKPKKLQEDVTALMTFIREE